MSAYRHRIYIIPNAADRPPLIMEFPLWWDRRAFFQKYSERKLDTGHPIYVDYGLLLTASEAIARDREHREAFATDRRRHRRDVTTAMGRLEPLLLGARWVVESNEWESGLD